jgi:adenylate kinase
VIPRPLNVVFFGPPGAGKGTQSVRVAESNGLAHISTGELFRRHLDEQTPVGLMAQGFMDRGLLVPDDIVCQMVRERLDEEDTEPGFILDGFPRTVHQAEVLEGDLKRMARPLTMVISFAAPDAVILERLTGRLTCRTCGAVYHIRFHPPASDNVCDVCGGSLYVRDDDRKEAVQARLDEYRVKTAPLLDFYGSRGLLRPIDATQSVTDVSAALEGLLEGR